MAPKSLCLITALAPVPAFLGGSCPLGCSLSAPATGGVHRESPCPNICGRLREREAGRLPTSWCHYSTRVRILQVGWGRMEDSSGYGHALGERRVSGGLFGASLGLQSETPLWTPGVSSAFRRRSESALIHPATVTAIVALFLNDLVLSLLAGGTAVRQRGRGAGQQHRGGTPGVAC